MIKKGQPMKPPVKTSFRGRDVAYLVISIVLVGVGYAAYRGLYFVGENFPFAQEMILVFLGAAATIYLTAVLLNRQTELELRKEGQVLLFQQKHDTYMRVIEKVAEIVERERHDFALIDELRVISHKLAVVGSAPVVDGTGGRATGRTGGESGRREQQCNLVEFVHGSPLEKSRRSGCKMQKRRRPKLADESAAPGTDKFIVPYAVCRPVPQEDAPGQGCCAMTTLRGS